MYSAKHIALYILSYYDKHDCLVSNLKLQKILYFLQAQFLVAKGKPCFEEDLIAWDFGPVVKEVYDEYRVYGGASIYLPTEKLKEYYVFPVDRELIDPILDQIKDFSAAYLTNITLNQNPWKIAYHTSSKVIKHNHLIEYFSE